MPESEGMLEVIAADAGLFPRLLGVCFNFYQPQIFRPETQNQSAVKTGRFYSLGKSLR